MTDTETHHIATAVACLASPAAASRELWQPEREQQIAAAETLLASDLPYSARLAVKELHERLTGEMPSTRKATA